MKTITTWKRALAQFQRAKTTAGRQTAASSPHPLDKTPRPGIGRRQFLAMALTAGIGALAFARETPVRAEEQSEFSLSSFRTLSLYTARACVSSAGDWVRPGGPYYEMYARDTFWVLMALRDIDLSGRIYRKFADQQYASGHIPTLLARDGRREAKEDESTLLFILWAYTLWKAGTRLQSEPVTKAWQFVEKHVQRGRYVTGPGTYHYWLDTLGFGGPDVVAYNQGLYAVAARCARQMGIATSATQATEAEQAYRGLYRPEFQTITLSEKSDLLDVSSLAGEYLALHLTNRPILTDDQVQSTLQTFVVVTHSDGEFLGYRVSSHNGGEYLDPSWLPESTDNLPGEYQNGASWLLYDALALGAGILHNDSTARGLLLSRFRSEVRLERSLHEYLSTHPNSPYFGVGPAYRRGYGWNAFAHIIGERVGLTDEEPVLM